jgi:hypothetical protein
VAGDWPVVHRDLMISMGLKANCTGTSTTQLSSNCRSIAQGGRSNTQYPTVLARSLFRARIACSLRQKSQRKATKSQVFDSSECPPVSGYARDPSRHSIRASNDLMVIRRAWRPVDSVSTTGTASINRCLSRIRTNSFQTNDWDRNPYTGGDGRVEFRHSVTC